MTTNNNMPRYRYIVLVSSAKMPARVKSRYSRVAVVRVLADATHAPKAIRETSECRIMATWERCYHGKTAACAFRVAWSEAIVEARMRNRAIGWERDLPVAFEKGEPLSYEPPMPSLRELHASTRPYFK